MEFTDLERAVLNRFQSDYRETIPGLTDQLNAVRVIARENTGGGFFTHLAVDESKAPPIPYPSPIGAYHVTFVGMRYPIEILLFIDGGYAALLEGFSVAAENTRELDLTTAAHGEILAPEDPGWLT